MTGLFSCSASRCDCFWKLGGLPVLTHPYLMMVGTVILSDLVTSSFHLQFSMATLKLLQKALLASFYSLVTSFWPVIFCGNLLTEDYFSTVSYFWCFIRHTEYFGISYISERNLKSGRWVERAERSRLNPFFAYTCPGNISTFLWLLHVDRRPLGNLSPSIVWKRSTGPLVSQSPNPTGHLNHPHRFWPWDKSSLASLALLSCSSLGFSFPKPRKDVHFSLWYKIFS